MIMLSLLLLLMVDMLHSVDSARYARFSEDYVTNIGSFASSDTRNVVYLGAKNKIMKLHFATRVFVPQFEVLSSRCRLGDNGCADYMQHVLLADGSIFNIKENNVLVTCGTNGGKPRCVLRDLGLLRSIMEVHALKHVATKSPDLKSFATVHGKALYYASYLTSDKSHAIIGQYTSDGTLTSKLDPRWFDQAEFVALQPIDDHVYVFFKEMSMGPQPMLTSRVARVCQKDKGGNKLILHDHFTTFTKTTITCASPSSIAGVPDYTYNFIDGIAIPAAALEDRYSTDRKMYAIFSNIPNGPCYTSAICAYNIDDMDTTFKTDQFVKVEHGQETVHTVRSVSGTCDQPRSLYDAHLYNQLKETISQSGRKPTYEARCRKYTAIAADRVNNIDVLFIATDDDLFIKMAINKGVGYLVDSFRIRKEKHAVEKIVKLPGENYVLASSPSFLLRIPVAQCRRFNDCTSCVESRDPYCGWCPVYNKCVATISCPKPVTNHHDELDSDNLCYPYQDLQNNNTRRARMKKNKIKKRRRLK